MELISIKPRSRYCLRSLGDGVLLNYPAGRGKATLGYWAFEYCAPHLWNNLLLKYRCAASLDSSKSLLKKHLFKKAFK